MEILFRLPFGSVGFYNGSHAELLVDDLFIPNGLALSSNKKYVERIPLYITVCIVVPFTAKERSEIEILNIIIGYSCQQELTKLLQITGIGCRIL